VHKNCSLFVNDGAEKGTDCVMSRFLPMAENGMKKSVKVRGRGVMCTVLKQSYRVRNGWGEM